MMTNACAVREAPPWLDSVFCAERYLDTAILSSTFKRCGGGKKSELLARTLIARFGSLAAVVRARPEDWMVVNGMTAGCADALALVQAAIRSSTRSPVEGRSVLSNWSELVEYLRASMANSDIEIFRVLFLGTHYRLLADVTMSTGTVDEAPVYPREVIRAALEHGATKLILVHNHPSGSLEPSREDFAITERISEAGQHFDIIVQDHVIVTRGGYTSFRLLDLI